MSKTRVYELARELNVESKVLVKRLKDAGIKVASHQSTITNEEAESIRKSFATGSKVKAPESDAKKPKVVIRRRRRSTSEEDEGDAAGSSDSVAASADESASASSVVRKRRVDGDGENTKPGADGGSGAVADETTDHGDDTESKKRMVDSGSPSEPTQSTGSRPVGGEGRSAALKDAESLFKKTTVGESAEKTTEQTTSTDEEGVSETQSTVESSASPQVGASGEATVDGKSSKSDSSKQTIDLKTRPDSTESAEASDGDDSSATPADRAKEQRDRIRKRLDDNNAGVSGATIVRRATPQEVENLEAKQKTPGRREDSRGTRVTGMGLLGNRGSSSGNQSQGDDGPPTQDEWGQTRRRAPEEKSRDFTSKAAEEEEAAKRRVAAAKAKRANAGLTTRALLDQAQTKGTEEFGRFNPGGSFQPRTYTPSSHHRSRRDLKRRKDLKKTQITMPKAEKRVVEMGETITVGELAKALSVKSGELIKKLMGEGVMATLNQSLDFDTATLMASEYKYEVRNVSVTVEDLLKPSAVEAAGPLETRPPIVTVMGHVDHGKTSILDAIKKSNVASGEAGGITQHIGAYQVETGSHKITFLDTPGHEAFSSMRSRGAKVTDIVVLVVAADDGVMPQTVEAISHAKAAEVPIIVAVNKIDKPSTNVERVYTELAEQGVQAEEWGGEIQFIKCSALEGTGLDELLEAVALQAEVLELKATSEGEAEAVVIEAHLDRGRGPVATAVVQRGTLRTGDYVVAGTHTGRVRGMFDHLGTELREAGPSQPVELIGLSGVPNAGDSVNSVEDDRRAKQIADLRATRARDEAARRSSASSLEDLLSKVQTADAFEVNFIIKGDTQGSVEAVSEGIIKLNTDRVKNKIIHSAVGGVSESDISLAAASEAIIIAFNVRAARGLDDFADKQGVMVRYFSIIYDIVDVVKSLMVGKLPPIVSEVVQGRAEVRKPISVPKIGTVAGSAVTDGKITRNAQCRLIRDDIVIYSGKLQSLRRFKDDVREVQTGYECGISIDGYNDIKEGDVIEAFVLEEQAATL